MWSIAGRRPAMLHMKVVPLLCRSCSFSDGRNCGYSAVAVHLPSRRHPLRDAEADSHGARDHGESPVACGQGGQCPYYAGRAGHWRSLRDTEVDLHGFCDSGVFFVAVDKVVHPCRAY